MSGCLGVVAALTLARPTHLDDLAGFKGLLPKKDYGIISRQAFIRLHTPFRASAEDDSDNNYAGGWYRNQNPNRINHDGSYANFRSKMTGEAAAHPARC